MSRDDVLRTPRNYLTGLDLDRFEAGQSATMRPSRWNSREEEEKAAVALGAVRRAVNLASLCWTRAEKLLWLLCHENKQSAAAASTVLGITPSNAAKALKRLRASIGIELTTRDVEGVQGTPPQRRPKPRTRRVTRSESLCRIRLPGHERELHWLRGAWIDLMDHTCRSNPTRRTMTKDEADGKHRLGDSVMRELVTEA